MRRFTYTAQPARVVFGAGVIEEVASELDALGVRRALVLSTPQQRGLAERVAALLGARGVAIFDQAVMHVPIETVRAARALATRVEADGVVAAGGGSTIGLAKALALDSGLPILAIPTTYAGSEMTPIHGITDGGVKRTGRDPRVLPRTVLYDPSLTTALPLAISHASGLNAIAHAAEALYARNANPITMMMARAGITALARALPKLRPIGADDARADALYGAWLCGSVLASADMGLHHQLCHTLGGAFALPHAETHAVLLPQVLAYNAAAAPLAMAQIAEALGAVPGVSAAQAMFDLARTLALPASLRDIGLREGMLDQALTLTLQRQYPNPRAAEPDALRALLRDAHAGTRPAH